MEDIEFNPFKDPITGKHFLILADKKLTGAEKMAATKLPPQQQPFILGDGTHIPVIDVRKAIRKT